MKARCAWRAWTTALEGAPLAFPGWSVAGPDRIRNPDGRLRWLLHPPTLRSWSATGTLVSASPVDWRLEATPDGAELRVGPTAVAAASVANADRVEIDVVELDGEVARAFETDRSAPITVLGSFVPLGGPGDLATFLVGGTVLDTTSFGGRRCPSEQTALSMYRVARLRGGAFWDGVAVHLAAVVAARLEAAPEGLPVHDLWGKGECHARFLADAALLMTAEAERDGDARWAAAAARAHAGLTQLSVRWGGGRWHLHDSAEAGGGENHLVLNTHIHGLVARLAAGEDVGDGLTALDAALALRPSPRRGRAGRRSHPVLLSGAMALADAVQAAGGRAPDGRAPTGWLRPFAHLGDRAQAAAAEARRRQPHLRLPGGWLARDAGSEPAPAYFTVNLSDLAVLNRVASTPQVRAAVVAGVARARATGWFRGRRLAGDPLSVLAPSLLLNAGHPRAARRAADALAAAGWAPAVGWPGHRDHLWWRLPPGLP